MPYNCRKSFCPECMEGYVPLPPPEPGSTRWKDQQAFRWVVDRFKGLPEKSCIIKLPADWGYFAVRYHRGSGYDYWRTDSLEEPA